MGDFWNARHVGVLTTFYRRAAAVLIPPEAIRDFMDKYEMVGIAAECFLLILSAYGAIPIDQRDGLSTQLDATGRVFIHSHHNEVLLGQHFADVGMLMTKLQQPRHFADVVAQHPRQLR